MGEQRLFAIFLFIAIFVALIHRIYCRLMIKLRAIFKDLPFVYQLFSAIVVVCSGMLLSTLVFGAYLLIAKGDMNWMSDQVEDLRILQLFASFGTFFFPALCLSYLFGERIPTYLQLRGTNFSTVLLTVVTILFLEPFLNYTVYLNEQLVFPEFMAGIEDWLRQTEENAQQLTLQLLQADSIGALIFNVFLVGVVAAVSEEFLFRGVLQRIFEKLFKNPHVVIWMVACIFSAIHLQFYGFIPRLLLGALMGYLLLYTQSLWIPVIAHFTNNTYGVLAYGLSPNQDVYEQLEHIGTGDSCWLAGVSLALATCSCWLLGRNACIRKKSQIDTDINSIKE